MSQLHYHLPLYWPLLSVRSICLSCVIILIATTSALAQEIDHPGCTGNEAWLAVDATPGPIISATEIDGDMYALHYTSPSFTNTTALSRWNGQIWETVSQLSTDSVEGLTSYRGDIYIANNALFNDVTARGLAKWDGTSWHSVLESVLILDLIVYDDALYIAGVDSWINIGEGWVKKWNGTTWMTLASNRGSHYYSFAELNGTLYIGGDGFDSGSGYGLARLDGEDIIPIENGIPWGVTDITPHNDGLFIQGWNGNAMLWSTTSTVSVPPPPRDWQLQNWDFSAISYNGDLYLADNVHKEYPLWRWSNGQWLPVSSLSEATWASYLFSFIEYNGDLYACGNFTTSCGAPAAYLSRMCVSNECATISGTVFHDANNDCLLGGNEAGLEGRIIEVLPGPHYTMTDAVGNYAIVLPEGDYSVAATPYHYWQTLCPQAPYVITLSSPGSVASGNNFATEPIPGIHDVSVSLVGSTIRPGNTGIYTVQYRNVGTEPTDGTLTLRFNGNLSFRSATVEPDLRTTGLLTWDFFNLQVGESVNINIELALSESVGRGTKLCSSAEVTLQGTVIDEMPADNSDEFCTVVRTSYDPNTIQVSPAYTDKELDEVPLHPEDSLLTYVVQFQNTGDDTAVTVVVTDTLNPSLLDIPGIRLGGASHDYHCSLSGSGVLTWTFTNIMLPDSNVNEVASHGYFTFTIPLQKGLSPLTHISNQVSIYFDYNEAVRTNSVTSVTSGTSLAEENESGRMLLNISPNPIGKSGSISLNLPNSGIVLIRLVNVLGQRVATIAEGRMDRGEQVIRFDTDGFPSGLYFLQVDREESADVYPIIIGK